MRICKTRQKTKQVEDDPVAANLEQLEDKQEQTADVQAARLKTAEETDDVGTVEARSAITLRGK